MLIRVILILVLLWSALSLVGCGTDSTRQTRTVETMETTTGPIVADVPMVGQVTVQPVRTVYRRTQQEDQTTETRIVMPDVGQFIAPMAAGATGLGPLAGILGLATAAFTGWKALQFRRQRNEVIDGVEAAKGEIPSETWQAARRKLTAAQSADTVSVIHERTP